MTNSTELISRLYQYITRRLVHKDVLETISLYDLIWKPIAPHLDGISKVYYVCDGVLHNLALHAIPTDLETVVSDSIHMLQMTSFRSLIRNGVKDYSEKMDKALLIGGVHYGEMADSSSQNRYDRARWVELPWTQKEVDAIAGMMKKYEHPFELLKGAMAKKSTLRQKLSSSTDIRVIHFATHGFFETNDLLGVKSKVDINQANLELTHCGLVLANANVLERKDAMLTAFEISELDLSHTELVVLSACETGLGQVYEHEGVYGMQRAFKIAGAKYIIMSLWQVPDRETKAFMTEFYKNYLQGGQSIPEAFYKTQRRMKETLLNPVDWAGFVLLK